MTEPDFWNARTVLVTGHTGFKGTWLTHWLLAKGALVHGLSLTPQTSPSLFDLSHLEPRLSSNSFVDLRDRDEVFAAVARTSPDIVFHLASQALVRRGLRDPFETFSVNVLGLVNLLDALRKLGKRVICVNVTSDKVYENDDRAPAFREVDKLGGDDPYSASKACAELVTHAYEKTVGRDSLWLCTARAGNVIGGGDWAEDRLIPDLVRAAEAGIQPLLRNPDSTRPWQHVLDPLNGYMLLAQRLASGDESVVGAWNFGPNEARVPTVGELAEGFMRDLGFDARWSLGSGGGSVEKTHLRVDSTKARSLLRWRSRLSIRESLAWTADWYRAWLSNVDSAESMSAQISQYERLESDA